METNENICGVDKCTINKNISVLEKKIQILEPIVELLQCNYEQMNHSLYSRRLKLDERENKLCIRQKALNENAREIKSRNSLSFTMYKRYFTILNRVERDIYQTCFDIARTYIHYPPENLRLEILREINNIREKRIKDLKDGKIEMYKTDPKLMEEVEELEHKRIILFNQAEYLDSQIREIREKKHPLYHILNRDANVKLPQEELVEKLENLVKLFDIVPEIKYDFDISKEEEEVRKLELENEIRSAKLSERKESLDQSQPKIDKKEQNHVRISRLNLSGRVNFPRQKEIIEVFDYLSECCEKYNSKQVDNCDLMIEMANNRLEKRRKYKNMQQKIKKLRLRLRHVDLFKLLCGCSEVRNLDIYNEMEFKKEVMQRKCKFSERNNTYKQRRLQYLTKIREMTEESEQYIKRKKIDIHNARAHINALEKKIIKIIEDINKLNERIENNPEESSAESSSLINI